LRQFIADLPSAANDPIEDLRRHFPGLFEADTTEQNWQQQIARLSTPQPYELMGSAETERLLEEKLRLKISERGATKTYELAEFPLFVKQAPARKALRSMAVELSTLAARAHPIYAPIIGEYAAVASRLGSGSTIGIPRRLKNADAECAAVKAQMREVDDYLNWFEATSLGQPSGQFASYLRAADRAAQKGPNRKDPISVYLDALAAQFDN
jgi:hypothetical protein